MQRGSALYIVGAFPCRDDVQDVHALTHVNSDLIGAEASHKRPRCLESAITLRLASPFLRISLTSDDVCNGRLVT